MRRRFILAVFLLVATPFFLKAEGKTVRVLTVGNSFAENALTYLPQLAEAAGHKLIVGKANLGGCTFERHWNHVAAYIDDPESEAGSPYSKGRHSLDELLKKEEWDYITIQQVSYRSHDLNTYYPYARDLYQYIRERAPDAKILAHQIWAYRVDDQRFVPANEGKEPHTQEVMYSQVRKAYHTLVSELQLDGILPSGDAMFAADTDPEWGYQPNADFDFENAEHPALPDQKHSLHTGWHWRKNDDGTRKLRLDGHHAGNAGKYLLGCVWFETLFGESVVANEYVPKTINKDYAKFLRETAHNAVVQIGGTPGKVIVRSPEDKRIKHLSWPKIVRSKSGTLVLGYSAGVGHNAGGSGLAVSLSKDDGATFSESELLCYYPDDGESYRDVGNLALGIGEDGTLILLAMAYTPKSANTILGWRSTDDGATWTKTDVSALDNNQTGSVFGHVFPVPGKGIAVCGHYREPKGDGIWISYSGDNGKSWGEPETITEKRFFEPVFIHSGDRFVGLVRENDAHAYHQFTRDGKSNNWEMKSGAIQAGTKAVHPSPYIIADPRNEKVLYSLVSERSPVNRISLWRCDADKLDWQEVKTLAVGSGDWTYPWMTHLGGDEWYLVYYQGDKKSASIYGKRISIPL